MTTGGFRGGATFPGPGLLTWKNIVPRADGPWDIFGNGGTVAKTSFGTSLRVTRGTSLDLSSLCSRVGSPVRNRRITEGSEINRLRFCNWTFPSTELLGERQTPSTHRAVLPRLGYCESPLIRGTMRPLIGICADRDPADNCGVRKNLTCSEALLRWRGVVKCGSFVSR
jgi:hypothetical protein